MNIQRKHALSNFEPTWLLTMTVLSQLHLSLRKVHHTTPPQHFLYDASKINSQLNSFNCYFCGLLTALLFFKVDWNAVESSHHNVNCTESTTHSAAVYWTIFFFISVHLQLDCSSHWISCSPVSVVGSFFHICEFLPPVESVSICPLCWQYHCQASQRHLCWTDAKHAY